MREMKHASYDTGSSSHMHIAKPVISPSDLGCATGAASIPKVR